MNFHQSLVTPSKLPKTSSKKKLCTPSTISHESRSFNQQNLTMTKLIGHDKLLNSFNLNSNKEQFNENLIEDRFIPCRRLLKKQYSSCQNKIQLPENKDPQTVSIAQIYYHHVLGVNQLQTQSDFNTFYKNNNLLKYRYEPEPKRNIYDQQFNKNKTIFDFKEKKSEYNLQKCRKVNKTPCKVLDAPALQDDFYLNLIDWSHQNQLAVGLGNCIYLWNAQTSKVTKLFEHTNDIVTSVCWASKGSLLSIGCSKGDVLVWDVNCAKQLRKMGGHQGRIGAMTWNSKLLATGSRDKTILLRDVRIPTDYCNKLNEHNQQICGLKWSLDQQYLASGGNDNKVVVWTNQGQIVNKFVDHKAAVKAIAWSPYQHSLLATGGGTADRMIKMRNIFTGKIVCEKDAGSQVCNIAFSKSLHEIVTTHGYSQNQINIWTYPKMKKTATLIGHSQRVLYLATSPDGSTIVTGAGDETLRFWNVFPSTKDILDKSQNISVIQKGDMLR